ncbi:MAG: HAMP domain-containing sensor histidine kinase [Hyphomicrobiaceae bacterium]
MHKAEGRTGDESGAAARYPTVPTRLGLSAKLLLLTALFVMLAEVLIFMPSIANYRVTWLMERLQAAQIASLAAEAAPDGVLPEMLREELLRTASVRGVALKRNDQRVLILSEEMPPAVDEHFDLRADGVFKKLIDAIAVFLAPAGRTIRVVGEPGMHAGDFIEIIMSEDSLKAAMVGFALNILGLSVVISLVTAALVYLALHGLLVGPMRRLTESMVAFSAHPENADRVIRPSGRRDELGIAEQELSSMQTEIRSMLQQRSRLAALGLAVSKINHDLRNLLATAQLISDRLGAVRDPTVERVTPRLIASLDRAIRLCADTLRYGQAKEPAPERRMLRLKPLVTDLAEDLGLPAAASRIDLRLEIDEALEVDADPDQLYRILSNLIVNAMQVLEARGAPDGNEVTVKARRLGGLVEIDVGDTGPGIPEMARRHLFEAFQGSARPGGTGLGLAIVAELVRAHGGEVVLHDEGPGTTFRVTLPDRAARPRR